MFSGLEPVADIFFVMYCLECLWSYVLPQHSKKASASDGLCDYFTSSNGKELESSSQILYKCDAYNTLGNFSLGCGLRGVYTRLTIHIVQFQLIQGTSRQLLG